MERPRLSWAQSWLSMARIAGKRSGCTSQVGAVAVGKNNRIVATGYNGPPAGYPVSREGEWDCERDCPHRQGIMNGIITPGMHESANGECPAVHAEMNALLYCDRADISGGTVYIDRGPCFHCARLMANSGASEVVWVDHTTDSLEVTDVSARLLIESGLNVVRFSQDDVDEWW